MKKIVLKISSFLMALMVVFSTMSFAISEHYCGDEMVNSSLFFQAESCGLDMEKPSSNEGCAIEKNNCCKDVVIQVEGQDELNINVSNLNFDQHVLIASFIYTYKNLFEGLENKVSPFQNYTPPLVDKEDLQVLFQTFRI